ncbi:MAG: hypothetical protein QXY47_05495 [Thermoplasmata archaeon]
MPFISQVRDEPEQSKYVIGFPKGLNTLQDRSLINDKQLIQADNVELVVDGITKRRGTKKVFDSAGTKVLGASPFYIKSHGTRYFIRAVKTGESSAKLQYISGAGTTWTDIPGGTLSSANKVCFVQARNRLFVYNGVDKLRAIEKDLSITTYTQITAPTGLSVSAQGTTGTTRYSYRVSAFNKTGETNACARVVITNGNATLSTSNFNKLQWTAVSGADGYNIYGRYDSGYEEVYLNTVYGESNTTYNDTGTDAEVPTKPAPEDNNTGGVIGNYAIFTLGRQYVIGIKEGTTYYPTRIYYSGVLNYVDSFAGGEYGGGWVDVSSNDGGEIVGIAPYQTAVIIFKTNGIFKFSFSTGGIPVIEEITREHGGTSPYAIKNVANDIMYVGQKENRIVVYTLGQQANYTGDLLRTNEISIFISNSLTDINRSYLSNIAAFYYDDKFGFTYTKTGDTENSRGFVIDTRFAGWVKWEGLPMKATYYTTYDDGTNYYLYGLSNHDGYMIKMFESTKTDNGEVYKSVVGTKFFSGEQFDIEKIWRNPVLWFKYISVGKIQCEVWVDGTKKIGTASFNPTVSGVGFGTDLFGQSLLGITTFTIPEQTVNADMPQQIDMIHSSKTIGFYLIDNELNSDWLFMGMRLLYSPLEGKPLPESYRVSLT